MVTNNCCCEWMASAIEKIEQLEAALEAQTIAAQAGEKLGIELLKTEARVKELEAAMRACVEDWQAMRQGKAQKFSTAKHMGVFSALLRGSTEGE